MAKKAKKHRDRAPAPVATGHDKRSREREARQAFDTRGRPSAPDGISGNWS